jgi:hypothetical protein
MTKCSYLYGKNAGSVSIQLSHHYSLGFLG